MLGWKPCGCAAQGLVRIERSFWMRLVPSRRHYYCPACKSSQFLSRADLLSVRSGASRPAAATPSREMELLTVRLGDDSLDPDATRPARYL